MHMRSVGTGDEILVNFDVVWQVEELPEGCRLWTVNNAVEVTTGFAVLIGLLDPETVVDDV